MRRLSAAVKDVIEQELDFAYARNSTDQHTANLHLLRLMDQMDMFQTSEYFNSYYSYCIHGHNLT